MFRALGALRPTKGCQRSEARPRERIKTAIRATRAMRHPNLWKTPPSPGRGRNAVAAETSTRGDGVEYATTTRRPLPCPSTKSVCNDFADAPGRASSSTMLAAAATARRSPARMRGVLRDGVCVGTTVDATGSSLRVITKRHGVVTRGKATLRAVRVWKHVWKSISIAGYSIRWGMSMCGLALGAPAHANTGHAGENWACGHASRRARAAARPRRASLCRRDQ